MVYCSKIVLASDRAGLGIDLDERLAVNAPLQDDPPVSAGNSALAWNRH